MWDEGLSGVVLLVLVAWALSSTSSYWSHMESAETTMRINVVA
jgi:hypothetical protein